MRGRVILVGGMPSGGTSVVAGILHHLGVDMGRFKKKPAAPRDYWSYECWDCVEKVQRDVWPFSAIRFNPERRLSVLREKLDEYLRVRMYTPGPWGFKNVRIFALLSVDHEWASHLPLEIVRVYRPREEALAGEEKRYRGKLQANRLARAAVLWEMQQETDRKVKLPRVGVHFRDVLEEPEGSVRYLARTLRLEPSEEQVKSAVEFVRPR